jgi:hypothetical protein
VLAESSVTPAQLPESTGARHDPPGVWVVNQDEVKRQQIFVVER